MKIVPSLRSLASCAALSAGTLLVLAPAIVSANPFPSSSLAYFGGGFDHNIVYGLATDDAGNSYTAGEMRTKSTFGTSTFLGQGSTDGFVLKVDTSGAFVWALHLSGTGNDVVTGIATDHWNNVYVTGYFEQTATFGNQNLVSSGLTDSFLFKLDSAGNVVWNLNIGSTANDVSFGVATHDNGDIVIAGEFSGTLTIGNQTATSAGGKDAFIARFNTYGDLLWLQNAGGTGDDYATTVTTDINDKTHIAGVLGDNATMGTNALTKVGPNAFSDAFLATLSSNGTFSRAQSFYSSNQLYVRSIAADLFGNVALIGHQSGTSLFRGAPLVSSGGGYDGLLFVVQLDGDVKWAQLIGDTQNEWSYDVTFDEQGNLYTTGAWGRTFSFGTIQLTSNGANNTDIYVAKLNAQGAYQWVHPYGLETADQPGSIAIDRDGRVHTSGSLYMTGTTYTLDLVVFRVNGATPFARAIPTTTTTTSTTAPSSVVATSPSSTTDTPTPPPVFARTLPDTGNSIDVSTTVLCAATIALLGFAVLRLRRLRSS